MTSSKNKEKISTKSYVLSKLEHSKGEYIKGMDLAEELGVSRNAIWKAINELKADGYKIDSVNNRGYLLDSSNDILSLSAIREELSSIFEKKKRRTNIEKKIDTIIDNIVIYDELESTNLTAKMNFITGNLDKRVIIARSQTAGVGHNRKHFDSPEGGIYMSFILEPSVAKKYIGTNFTPTTIGEAVRKVLEELTNKNVTLDKKFNRISISGKVICGILTEYFADMETNTVNGYVIGIGIKDIGVSKNKIVASILSLG